MQLHTTPVALTGNTPPLPSKPEYKVRCAVEADIPALVQMGRDLHKENGLMPFSERKACDMVWRAVHKDRAAIGVIGPEGNPEAAVTMILGQYWYTEYWHLEELCVFVKPEFRRSPRAKHLIRYAKQCALDLKMPLIIGIISHSQTEAKRRLYERELGPASGYYFLFNGKTGT